MSTTHDEQYLNITLTTVPAPEEDAQTNEEKTQLTADVMVIMDASGSMASMGNEPIEAINTFITDQKKLSTDPDARFSLYTFNSKTYPVYEEKKLSEIDKFDDYYPGGMTALYECVHKAITKKLAGDRKKNVCLVIISDGEENSSPCEYNKLTLSRLIKKAETDHNWKVMYLGANIDAFVEGGKIGTATHHCAQYDQAESGDMCQLLRSASNAVKYYRRSAYTNLKAKPVDLTRMRTAPASSTGN